MRKGLTQSAVAEKRMQPVRKLLLLAVAVWSTSPAGTSETALLLVVLQPRHALLLQHYLLQQLR